MQRPLGASNRKARRVLRRTGRRRRCAHGEASLARGHVSAKIACITRNDTHVRVHTHTYTAHCVYPIGCVTFVETIRRARLHRSDATQNEARRSAIMLSRLSRRSSLQCGNALEIITNYTSYARMHACTCLFSVSHACLRVTRPKRRVASRASCAFFLVGFYLFFLPFFRLVFPFSCALRNRERDF